MINKIYCENCLDTMARMPDNFVDLTVTSPPYDNLRDYNGYSFDFPQVAQGLFRVTKIGGVVVWVVGDATIKGSETGTSFRQALYFKEIGFNLHDTMIYAKKNPVPYHHNRYNPQFEYMFVLTKGKLSKFYPLQEKTKCLKTGKYRYPDGSLKNANTPIIKDSKILNNIWFFSVGQKSFGHPATFPEQLANDHIISWSNPGDLVYDPFMGSGTTAKMAIINGRNWIGSEISEEYCRMIEERISSVQTKMSEVLAR